MSVVLALPRAVDAELAADIQKESVYISPQLTNLRVLQSLDAVEIEMEDGADAATVQAKALRFLASMMKRTHTFDTKVFLHTARRDTRPFATKVHNELKARGWLFDYGTGQVALRGPALALAQAIDTKAAQLYHRAFDAAPGSFPAFVDAEILKKCGYFDSHPNAVTFACHVIDDFDAIEEFRQANSCAEHAKLPRKEHVHLSGVCLNPAACFPCYPTLTNTTVAGEGVAFTWQGRVFRHESRNISGLERLWEFNVRELVFVGTEDYVVETRRRALPVIEELAEYFDLEIKVETAADPFFATVSAARTFWQRSQEVKNELRLPVEPNADGQDKTIAGGSINIHGKFFGDRFSIRTEDGGTAFTGCIGLGIERWVLSAFTQHGFDPQRWPAAARTEIFA
jgi:seryl-tRNA synthetase